MNSRIAKKIVKKYGTSWLVVVVYNYNYKYIKDDYDIPYRWNNKNVRKWMGIRYPLNKY